MTETSECQHSQNGKDIHDCYSTIRKDRNYELFVGTRERAASASCIQEKPQHDAPMCTKHSRSEKAELSLLFAHLGSYYSPVNDSFDQAASHWTNLRSKCPSRGLKNITRGLITSFRLIFLAGKIHFKHILNRPTHSLQTLMSKELIFSPNLQAHQFTNMPV